MGSIIKIENVSHFNAIRGQETLHPLVTVLDQSKSSPIQACRYITNLYIIFLKDVTCDKFQYGRNYYDHQEETLIFISPDQVFGFDETIKRMLQPNGWVMAFHPDFIRGTSLSREINQYNFFSYDVSEALHISNREKQIVLECFYKIKEEIAQNIDKHSKTLVTSNIKLLLDYCLRFYDRQFITRDIVNKDVLNRFEALVANYFKTDKPQILGLPLVSYFAKELNLSANYFGDLVRKETGKTAQEYIQEKVIAIAKQKIFDTTKSISEVSYEMGFKYPQHFTRLFKQKVGYSPNEYRMLN